jgi:hypothetical protein
MASRRQLLSVAHGTAHAFADRGNDVDGWWALGLLLRDTQAGAPDYSIDLLTGRTRPERLPGDLNELGRAWARYFAWSLERHQVPVDRVRTATLSITFDRSTTVYSWIPNNEDHPFICVVEIEDDRAHVHARSVVGHASRPEDFTDPNPWWRPRRSVEPHHPGRVAYRVRRTIRDH